MAGPTDPLVGSTLAPEWRIERRLGTRGMGTLYEAQSTRDGSYRMVEVLFAGDAPSDEAFARFERAVAAADALGHHGIAKVHAVGRTDSGQVYTVMDYLDGEDLASRLARDGALRWPDARRILDDVASGLTVAHGAGILHQHLEPASVFLMRRPGVPERALVLHFGVHELVEESEQQHMRDTGAYPRQSAYESPEKVSGEATDARSDLYSLAAILFEMITGAPPFTGPNVPAILARVLTETAPSVGAYAKQPFPTGLEDLLACALAKTPEARQPDVETFRRKIQSIEALQSWTWPSGADLAAPVRRSPPPPQVDAPTRIDTERPDPPAEVRPLAIRPRATGFLIVSVALAVAAVLVGAALLVANH